MAESFEKEQSKNYKFKELKTYASTEWLADNKKKYRQVFDRHGTSYIYAELSFYNKLYDREVWEIDIELKCFNLLNGKKELCALQFKRKVSKYDSVVYVREGWGNKKEGVFWKKGTYFWEAWVEGEKVATKYFYVEDSSMKNEDGKSKYLSIHSIKLYEGQYDDVIEEDRNYYKKFGEEETRYIYTEISLSNLNVENNWHCELFTKFYNEARELKGQVIRLHTVNKGDEKIKITAGWGSNVKGSWRPGNYTVELIFLDQLIAVIPFVVTDEFEEGIVAVQLPNRQNPIILLPEEDLNQSFDELILDLDSLIGLNEIKSKVKDHSKYLEFIQLRKDKGFEERNEINVNSVFIGNPGTGKTTVAKMMGKLYKKMGLLSKGHVHEVDRVDLVGEYIGQTAPKVKQVIDKARGGVLFIDEAYALARANDDSKDFGREVIEILVKEMSSGVGDMVVIVAGYPKEMMHFLDSNPGLKSRFKLYYDFPDYFPDELSQIAEYASKEKEVILSSEAKKKIDKIIVDAYRDRDRSFGNARFVHDIIEKAKINLGLRVMNDKKPEKLSKKEISTIRGVEIEKIELTNERKLPNIPVDEKLLEEAIAELNQMVGMDTVKKQILEMTDLVRYYLQLDKNVLNAFFLHTVFVGNPGTGKTTVARILTKIYKALGILERGHMVETDRQGLVAGFIGQTAIKTSEKIDEAIAGVLFIDEAYSLTGTAGSFGDYGSEVIQTILKRMEDQRGQFFVFAAGYPDNMEAFLKANPGLSSRFDKVLRFEDYRPEELFEIAIKMFKDEKLNVSAKAKKHLKKYFAYIYKFRDRYFGNARTVRNLVVETIKKQNLRLVEIDEAERTKSMKNTIDIMDVEQWKLDSSNFIFNRKGIGFKKS